MPQGVFRVDAPEPPQIHVWQLEGFLFETITRHRYVGRLTPTIRGHMRGGEGVSRLAHNQEIAGASPASATNMNPEGGLCRMPVSRTTEWSLDSLLTKSIVHVG